LGEANQRRASGALRPGECPGTRFTGGSVGPTISLDVTEFCFALNLEELRKIHEYFFTFVAVDRVAKIPMKYDDEVTKNIYFVLDILHCKHSELNKTQKIIF
jgi:hypothetical protein